MSAMHDCDDIEALKADVEQIKKTLYIGNGQPPVVARLTRAETDIRGQRETIAELKAGQTWIIRLVVANLVTGLGAMLPKLVALAQGLGGTGAGQ